MSYKMIVAEGKSGKDLPDVRNDNSMMTILLVLFGIFDFDF